MNPTRGTLKDAMEVARANPNSDYAKQLYNHIVNGEADNDAYKEGIDLSKFGRPSLEEMETDIRRISEESKRAEEFLSKPIYEQIFSKETGSEIASNIAKIAPTAGMIGGGFIGGATGGIPGAIVGSGVGAATGEALSQKLRDEKMQPEKIIAEGVIGAGTEAIGGPLVKGVGKVLEAGGQKLAESVIPKTIDEGNLIRLYRAGDSIFKRLGQAIGLSESTAPRTAGKTAFEKGLAGSESMIGVQATKEANTLWKNLLEPQIKKSPAVMSKEELFSPIEKRIAETVEPGRRQALLDAYEAIKEDYKAFPENFNLDQAQALKRGLDEFTPEKIFKGKSVANEYKTLKNDMANAVREKTYNTLPEGSREAFLDYGNLVNLQELGSKAIAGSKLKGASFTGLSGLKDMLLVPVGTIGGQSIYKIGQGLELIGKPGARILRDLFAPAPSESQKD